MLTALSPVLVPLTDASKGTVKVFEEVPPAMVNPVVAAVGLSPLIEVTVATPRTGVTRVGEVAKTVTPVPVSSVNAPDKLAELNEPNVVALPVEVTAPVRFALATNNLVQTGEPVVPEL